MPKTSIIMRSRNDAWIIQRTLDGLRKQRCKDWELIHIDSASEDETAVMVQPYTTHQVIIPAHTYIPGKVLNRGASLARGELLIFLNSDCVPLREDWLDQMIAGLQEAPVVYGRQVARADATLQVQRDYLFAFPPAEKQRPTHTRWRRNPSFEHFFSMACSGVRREVWEQHSFHESIRYSEDIEWADRVRQSGHEVRYLPEAEVEHSHNYDARACYRRFFGEGTAEAATFSQDRWQLSFTRRVLMPYASALWQDLRYSLRQGDIQQWPRSLWFRWNMHYGRYKGLQAQLQQQDTAFGAQNPNAGRSPA